MDVQFENRYVSSSQILIEYIYKVVLGRIQLILSLFIAAIIIAVIIVVLYSDRTTPVGLIVWCVLIVVWMWIGAPLLCLWRMKSQARRMHNWKQPESVLYFGERIAIEEGTITMKFEYSQITRTHDLRRSYVLMIGKIGIILSKEGFAKGSLDDFRRFISEKIEK
ncbi:MAG: YcxB family protein [Bauldia sp.]|nr:YcxB family protein [Bauldia sp.]